MQLISNKRWNNLNLQIKALQTNAITQSFSKISTQIFPQWQVYKEIEAYRINDDINSIISKLAINSATIPFYGFDKSTGEDLPDTDPLSKLLLTLDFEQKEILYTYFYLFGEVFIYKEMLEFGPNAGVQKLKFLHPNFMTLILSDGFDTEITGYIYRDTQRGVERILDKDEIIFIKTVNPATDFYNRWRGISKISVLAQTLTRSQSGKDASVAQLQNGGVPGIVYEKNVEFDSPALGKRITDFAGYLANSDNKGAPYFAAGEMGYLPMGLNLVDLDVAVLAEMDFDKIANCFGISTILFNSKKASTESNVQEMKKEMYTNTILSNVYRIEGALNKGLVPFIKTSGIIKCDTSDIPELHEDSTRQAAALAQMYWLTGNEKRAEMLFDQDLDNPLMNEYIIPSGMQLLSDLTPIDPLP